MGIPSKHSETDSNLNVLVSGDLWWNGFTADITLTNTSSTTVDNWSWSFSSPHAITGAPWGADINSVLLDDGTYIHTLQGTGWGSSASRDTWADPILPGAYKNP